MNKENDRFKIKYGPWALVAGGSEGIGGAFSSEIARNGINLVLIARRRDLLERKTLELKTQFGIQVNTILMDLASTTMLAEISRQTEGLEIGLLVYNAALARVGAFFNSGLEDELACIDVNCKGPLQLIHQFGKKMIRRQRGGIILMSSMAGLRGAPFYSHYAATKAYNIVLGESLWYEFRPHHVDVLTCIAGMTSSPQLMKTVIEENKTKGTSLMTPESVAQEALSALGEMPSVIPGEENRAGQEFMTGIPRKDAVVIMAKHAVKNFMDGKIPPQRVDQEKIWPESK